MVVLGSSGQQTADRQVVLARDLWTGDIISLHGMRVTRMEAVPGGNVIRVTVADVFPSRAPGIPLEVKNSKEFSYRDHDRVTITRGKPLINGMHMTQVDMKGYLHGGAHKVVEQRFAARGRLAPDYTRG